MDNSQPQTLRDVCQTFGLTQRALRYYEYIELVTPKIDDGKRLYGRRELARLKLILRGRRFGMRLEDLRVWLNLYDQFDEETQSKAWLKIAEEKEAELLARIDSLQNALIELRGIRSSILVQLKNPNGML